MMAVQVAQTQMNSHRSGLGLGLGLRLGLGHSA